MEGVKRADQLAVGDELVLDDGTNIQVRGVNLPGSEWNRVRAPFVFPWAPWGGARGRRPGTSPWSPDRGEKTH